MSDETPLEAHVKHDAAYEAEMEKRVARLEDKSMDGLQSDKVNINVGGGEGGGGGAGLAAVIAALGNRNQGNDNAALIAALGNRNDDSGNMMGLLGPLLAGNNGNNGMNSMWPILLLALLGRGRGGILGGGDDGACAPGGLSAGQAAILQTLMEGQSNLRAEIPTTALQTQNAIQGNIAQLALGTQQGFANVKDSVQTTGAFLDRDIQMANQNVSSQGCQTREAVQNDGDKTRGLLVARFQSEDATRIARLNAEVVELRNETRRRADHDELRLQISNTNTAVAAQSQGQAQQQQQQILQGIQALFPVLNGLVQVAHATNSNVIAGNTGAVVTGPQTANPTNVRA